MEEPTFDIFSGDPQNAIWLEAVRGSVNATQRMQALAAKQPGTYFLFCVQTQGTIAKIDTRKHLEPTATLAKKAGAA